MWEPLLRRIVGIGALIGGLVLTAFAINHDWLHRSGVADAANTVKDTVKGNADYWLAPDPGTVQANADRKIAEDKKKIADAKAEQDAADAQAAANQSDIQTTAALIEAGQKKLQAAQSKEERTQALQDLAIVGQAAAAKLAYQGVQTPVQPVAPVNNQGNAPSAPNSQPPASQPTNGQGSATAWNVTFVDNKNHVCAADRDGVLADAKDSGFKTVTLRFPSTEENPGGKIITFEVGGDRKASFKDKDLQKALQHSEAEMLKGAAQTAVIDCNTAGVQKKKNGGVSVTPIMGSGSGGYVAGGYVDGGYAPVVVGDYGIYNPGIFVGPVWGRWSGGRAGFREPVRRPGGVVRSAPRSGGAGHAGPRR